MTIWKIQVISGNIHISKNVSYLYGNFMRFSERFSAKNFLIFFYLEQGLQATT